MQLQTGRRTQAERTAATRDLLVSTARGLFADHGYADVSTEAIVRAAGVTRGALYHQFADKAELFEAVYEAVEADVTRLLAEQFAAPGVDDPIEAMVRATQAWLHACTAPEIHRIVLLDAPAVLGWARWREICLRYMLGLVEQALGAAMAAGRMRTQPTRPLAHVLLAAADEAGLYVASSDDPQTAREQMNATFANLVRSLAQ